MKAQQGSVLLETLLIAVLVGAVCLPCHWALLKQWRLRLENLQEQRLRYDGIPYQKS
ncbi:hypothetical protein K2X33_12705 [bacterium]|nr:hypothetical protein [bacterium]